jgi:hypothetical protein
VHKFAGSKCLFYSEEYQTFIVQKAGLKKVQNSLTLCTQRERCVDSIKALRRRSNGAIYFKGDVLAYRPRVC